MHRIPILRAGYLSSYLTALRESGVDPRPLLEKAGLPAAFEFHSDALVAAKPLHHFIQAASRHERAGVISMRAGLHHAAHLPNPFAEGSRGAVTVLDAIRRHNARVPHYSPENRFDVKLEEGSARWRKRGKSPLAETEIFCVANLIGHVRTSVGDTWRPDEVAVSVAEPEIVRNLPILAGVPVRRAPATTSIVLRAATLGRSIASPKSRRRATGPAGSDQFDPESLDYIGTLRLVLAGYLRAGSVSMATAARAVGVSPRTLQRRLQQLDLTYSELLSQIRFEAARARLSSGEDVSVTEIGLELGYSDPGSFTRAFRRFAGVPPSMYRRIAANPVTSVVA